MKQFFCLLMIALLSLSLLAGCGPSSKKLSDPELIDGYGTITRNGEEIDVLICHDLKKIYFYYDDEDRKLFDSASIPDEIYDKDWDLIDIDFTDGNDDNNSDLYIVLYHQDMSQSDIAWHWVEGSGYVYQPDVSNLYYPIVVRDPIEDANLDFSMYEGTWVRVDDNPYDDIYYIEIEWDGSWQLHCDSGDVIDDGYLFPLDDGFTYVYSYQEGQIDGGYIELCDDQIYISTLGYYFSRLDSEENQKIDYGSGNTSSDRNPELFQRDVSEFEGAWYYDNDLSAEAYIIIDGDGNWSLFQRTPGDAEGTEMDRGIFAYSADEVSTYYAESVLYDDVRYRVFEFDEGILIWDDDTYYRME